MTTKHTPLYRWSVEGIEYNHNDIMGHSITVRLVPFSLAIDVRAHNSEVANLIEAAPELLAALKGLLEYVKTFDAMLRAREAK